MPDIFLSFCPKSELTDNLSPYRKKNKSENRIFHFFYCDTFSPFLWRGLEFMTILLALKK